MSHFCFSFFCFNYGSWILLTNFICAEFSGIKSNDQEWYFFCRPQKKYQNSARINRTTKAGHWKSTGKDRKIKNEVDEVIGTKKSLVYLPNSPNSVGNKWIIHEYSESLNLCNQVHATCFKVPLVFCFKIPFSWNLYW